MKKSWNILLASAMTVCALGFTACKDTEPVPDFYRADFSCHVAEWDTNGEDRADRVIELYKVNETDQFNTLYLPASYSWESAWFVVATWESFMINGEAAEQSTKISQVFANGADEAIVTLEGTDHTIKLVRGELPTLFVTTTDLNWGSYPDDVNADLTGGIQADTAEGETLYDSGITSFKRRDDEKKDTPARSYTFSLDTACDLYGLGSNVNWTLVAMSDGAELNDTNVYQTLNGLGIDGAPAYVAVDLVLENYYRGNYILVAQ